MKIAIEGCAHGELDKIYEALGHLQEKNDIKVDLLVCCGDFQSVRNQEDLQCMAVPMKYLEMNTFYKYYSGEEKAPILTLFVGGNHEASNYLGELAYGGWVCPNIYYLGYAGIVNVGGVRIAGVSGIYKGQDYLRGHYEVPPYDNGTKRSVYHIRNIDIFRMKQISRPIDVFLSHDWPRGVHNFGNVNALLRKKVFLREDVESNKLGSRPTQELLEKLQPAYWFSAHLHVKFAAVVPHQKGEDRAEKKVTKFLALDKCLPRRDFLQILDIGPEVEGDAPLVLHYDAEWLAILKSTDHLLNVTPNIRYMPGPGSSERWDFTASDEELQAIDRTFNGDYRIPLNFQLTVATHDPSSQQRATFSRQPPIRINPQTTTFCDKLGITDPFQKILDLGEVDVASSRPELTARSFINDGEADVTASASEATFASDDLDESAATEMTTDVSTNPDEIALDDDDDEGCDELDVSSPVVARTSISGTLPEVHDLDDEACPGGDLRSSSDVVAAIAESCDEKECAEMERRPVVKAFKRRNQAIYAQDDRSDEDN